MWQFRSAVCSMILVLVSGRAEAQAVPTRLVDRRVRIQTTDQRIVDGRVLRVAPDSVFLRVFLLDEESRKTTVVAQTDVLRVEELTGMPRSRAAQRGALIGAGFGVALLVTAGVSDAKIKGEMMGPTALAVAAPAAVLITLLGTGIGAAIGG
jgi:hypothetical protein